MSERLTGRHRSSERASTPLSQLTDVVTDQFGDATRTGAIVVISTGLVAGAGLPASAASGRSATSTSVATVAAPAAPVAAAPAYSAVPAAAPLNVAPARGAHAALTAPSTAVVQFETGRFTAIPRPAAARPAATTAPAVRRPIVPKVAGTRAVAARANPVVKARAVTKAKPVKGKPTTAMPPKAKPAPAKPKPAPAKPKKPVAKAPATGGTAARGASVLSVAARYVGTPYKYGGTTPRGFDCSGFTRYVYKQLGVSIPRTANQQMLATKRVSRSKAKAGDLVFFVSGGRAYHVGIYAGKNMLYDSPRSGKKLSKRKIWDSSVVFGQVR